MTGVRYHQGTKCEVCRRFIPDHEPIAACDVCSRITCLNCSSTDPDGDVECAECGEFTQDTTTCT